MNVKKTISPSFRLGFVFGWLMIGALLADQPVAVLTNLPPSLNGKVVGDLQVNSAQISNYNSFTIITGKLYLPGTPGFNYYAGAVAPPISEGDGQEIFDPYEVSFNGPASVGWVVTRTDPVALDEVHEPSAPTGWRWVFASYPGDVPAQLDEIRSLTLNYLAGEVALPPGSYDQVTVNSSNGLLLGIEGAEEPTLYEFNRLTLNGGHLRLAGPVEIRVRESVQFSSDTVAGEEENPAWLTLSVYNGSFTLNSGSQYFGTVLAPNGNLALNGGSILTGQAQTNQLQMSTGTELRYAEMGGDGGGVSDNQAPIFTSEPVITIPVGAEYMYGVTTDDPDMSSGDSLIVTSTTLPEWMNLVDHGDGTATLSGTPKATDIGTHSVFLRVTDSEGAFAEQSFQVNVLAVNAPPVVDAGEDVVKDSLGVVMLEGMVTDDGLPEGGTLVSSWRVMDGDASSVTFSDTSSLATSATFSAPGIFKLRLSVSDGAALGFDELQVSILLPNMPPVVDAGVDISVQKGHALALSGEVSDDGLPENGMLVSSWSVLEGDTDAVVIYNPEDPGSRVVFQQTGIYRLRLTASDGESTVSDEVLITVSPQSNAPPVVNAGGSQHIGIGSSTRLRGEVEDDGRPVGGTLTHEWTQISGLEVISLDDPTRLDPAGSFVVAGDYRFRLTASDGELTSYDEVLITVALGNRTPEVDAGENFVVAEGSLGLLRGVVMDEGLPHDGEMVTQWSLVSGPGEVVFENSAHPVCSIEVTQPGEYVFRLHASDGEAEAEDEVRVHFGPPVNQPPVVDAGPDQSVDFVLTRTDNLLMNGDAELLDPDGTLTGWETVDAAWFQTLGGSGGYPSAVSGLHFFRPANSSFAELAQSIDVGLFAESIDEGSQLFEFAAYYRVEEKVRYDRPSVRVEYRDDGGVLLASSRLTLSPISNEWGFIADTSIAPAGTREIVVRLSALRSGATVANSVYFDLVTLRGVELAPVYLQGLVEDDGLPEDGGVTSEWRTISGPVSALFEAPESVNTRAYFSVPGVYVLGLFADDGALTAEDSMEVHVLDAEGSAQLVADAGPDLETSLPLADVFPSGTVDGVFGEDFTVSWTVLGENDRVYIENSETLHPTIRFYEIGTYTLRFSVSDGVRVAFDEVRVKVTCPAEDQPLDVMMVIDTSGSMSGDRIVNARLAAMQFLGRLAPQDRAGVVRFTSSATLSEPLTFDHAAAIDTVSGFTASGGTSIHSGISVAAQELLINGRVDARWVILLLSDGGSNYGAAINASQSAQASGVRIISIGLGSGTDENLMSDVASSRADYFFAEASEDLQPIYAGLANSFCRFFDGGSLAVFAGPPLRLPGVDVVAELKGRVTIPFLPGGATLSTEWSQVSGSGVVTFENTAEAVTGASFSKPGTYVLELTGRVENASELLTEVSRFLTVKVDQPTDHFAPDGLVAYWRGEGNVLDSVSNFHGEEPATVEYGEGPVDLAFAFGSSTSAVKVPTHGELDVGSASEGFTMEFRVRIDSISGADQIFGWYNDGGQTLFRVDKREGSLSRFQIYWRDGNGLLQSQVVPTYLYSLGEWIHFTLVYERNPGRMIIYRNGVHYTTISSVGTQGVPTHGDIYFGGHPNGTGILKGGLDEIAVYNRPLKIHEVSAQSLATEKLVLRENMPPNVDAGADIALHSIDQTASLNGFVEDDGLPLGSGLHTQWRQVTGPGVATFGDSSALSTHVAFDLPGIYTLELTADDGVAMSRNSLKVVVDWSEGALAPPEGLRAHWPGEGDGTEVVSGLNVYPVGTMGYDTGVVGNAFDHNGQGFMLVPLEGQLDVGSSPEGFTLEFWSRLDSISGEQVLAGWHDGTNTTFGILKSSTSHRRLKVRWKNADGTSTSVDSGYQTYTLNQWHHFAFTYDPESGQLFVYRDGTYVQTLSLPTDGLDTTGDFSIGGETFFSGVLQGAMDEVSVYDRQLTAAEVWMLAKAGEKGKSAGNANTAPLVDAGVDIVHNDQETPVGLSGRVEDDDLPNGVALTTRWSKVTGPGTVLFSDETNIETFATFDTPGIYTLMLEANDGLVRAQDHIRVLVEWTEGSVYPLSGLRAHWPGEGDGKEMVSGLDADPVGPVSYVQGAVGAAFHHAGQGFMQVTNGDIDVGGSSEGFTIEMWTRIDSISGEDFLAGWHDGTNITFGILKRSTSHRRFNIRWRNTDGETITVDSAYHTYAVNEWQHFAFVYDPVHGSLRIHRNGRFQQELALPAGGLDTSGGFSFGGQPPYARLLHGGLDEVSVYDRALSPPEIWEVYNAGDRGKIVPNGNQPPVVNAGPDGTVASTGVSAALEGVVADDGWPESLSLSSHWLQLSGPGTATFSDAASPQSAVSFDIPGVYMLELSASDGVAAASDSLRVEVEMGENTLLGPSGLQALWPGDGNGREVVSGYHASPVGSVTFLSGAVNQAFDFNPNSYYVAPLEENLNLGESEQGFTLEFWAKLDAISPEQVIAGWYDEQGTAQFTVGVRPSSSRYLRARYKNSDGAMTIVDTYPSAYNVGQWQHFAFTYRPDSGALDFYRDGVLRQTLGLSPGGFSTDGNFYIGGDPDHQMGLNGGVDEVALYSRALEAAEIAEIHTGGPAGRRITPPNRAPFVFAGYDDSVLDTMSFTLTGFAMDDGFPEPSSLSTTWTQVGGPSDVVFSDPGDVTSEVAIPDFGEYRFRLTAFDGEHESTSEVSVLFETSVPENLAPLVDASGPSTVALPGTALLTGTATDPDAGPSSLTVTWSMIHGPGIVEFDDAHALETTATFSVPGQYLIRFQADDGVATASIFLEITVSAEVLNQAPVVEAGPDRTVPTWETVTLEGTATDDGVPEPLIYQWSQQSGPAPVMFENATQAFASVQFPVIGTYVLQLRAFDGLQEGLDTMTVTVVDPENQPPVVEISETLTGEIGLPIPLLAVISDDGLQNGILTTRWRYESGPGGVSLEQGADGRVTAQFAKVGEHQVSVSVSDGEYTVSKSVYLTISAPDRAGPSVMLTSPAENVQLSAGSSLLLNAEASDDQGVIVSVRYYVNGTAVSPPLATHPYGYEWEGLSPGTYELSARAVNEIGQTAVSESVSVDVEALSPGIRLLAPESDAVYPVGASVTLYAASTGNAMLDSVDFVVDGSVVAVANQTPFVASHVFIGEGEFTIVARGQTADGVVYESEAVQIHLVTPAASAPELEIQSPSHGDTITAPTEIVGRVEGDTLSAYTLRIRPGSGPDDEWRILVSGTVPGEANGTPVALGQMDPTQLRNGIYELQLSAMDVFGSVYTAPSRSVVVEGGMKIGHLQLAFEDLNVPLSGIPVQLIRSYDSRSGGVGDFGPDWDLGYRSARVYTSGAVGAGWEEYVVRVQVVTGIPFYGIRPINRHVISVVVGEEVQQFEAYSPTEQAFFPLQAASIAFRPINGSTGTLTPKDVDTGNMVLEEVDGGIHIVEFDTFAAFDSDDWVYTSTDGTRLEISRVLGLRKLVDRNDNSLSFTENGILHSSGVAITFERDAEGRIYSIQDTEGEPLLYFYNEAGYLSSVTDRAGGTTWFDYVPHPADPSGERRLLDAITDPLGNRVLAAEYDDDGRLIGQLDAENREISFAHDILNRRQTVTDRLGNATVYEYGPRGNVVRTVDPLGHETLREYDDRDNEVRQIDALGNVIERSFDENNNVLTETEYRMDENGNPTPLTTTYTYDSFGNPLTITDPAGHAITLAYDSRGNLLEMTNAAGHATLFEYDSAGNLTAMVDPLGNRTESVFDGRGNILAITVEDVEGEVLRSTWFTYDNRGNTLTESVLRTLYGTTGTETGTETVLTQYEYDVEGRLLNTTYPDGTEVTREYDAAGQLTRHIDALGRITQHEYDDRGNRVLTTNPDGTSVGWTYDAEDRKLTEIHIDADNQVFQASGSEYDALGREVAVTNGDTILPDGTLEGPVSLMKYDAVGRMVTQTDPLGNYTTFEYDEANGSANRRTRSIDALGHVNSYAYDTNGNRISVTDARGHTTEFEYDDLNRLIRVLYPDGTETETLYDALGRRVSEIDELGRATDYAYDPLGRLVEIQQPAPASGEPRPITRYGYDELGNLLAQTDALARTTRYQYDALGRRTTRILPLGQVETFTYNDLGQQVARTDFNGHTISYAYDALGRLTEEQGDPAHPSLALSHAAHRHTFSYDAAGRVSERRVWSGSAAGNDVLHEETLSYNLRGQLIQVSGSQGNLLYNYDAAGNLIDVQSDNVNGVDLQYGYDALNRLQTVYDHGNQQPPDQHQYAYNEVGSLAELLYANGIRHAYEYDDRNRLTRLEIQSPTLALENAFEYQLNDVGHRTRITETSGRVRNFSYDNLNRLTREAVTGDSNSVNCCRPR